MRQPELDLDDIQGDVLIGMQKDAENFVFFKITDKASFKARSRQFVIGRISSARQVHQRERVIERRRRLDGGTSDRFQSLNLGFTKGGITELLGPGRQKLDPAFERGADDRDTIAALSDPPRSAWLKIFVSDRIDGVFLIAGPDRPSVAFRSNELLSLLGSSIKVVYSEIGTTRPGGERGHEHFGFLDGISQPGIRGLTPPSNLIYHPDQDLPDQDLIWLGEFVFGYPEQDPEDPLKAGKPPEIPLPWMRNGSYMVFRRLEQQVPEFRRFVTEQATRLGMDPQLLAARMVGRWKSGAPLELAPLRDAPGLGSDLRRRNDFAFGDDPLQRKCPYAAHIRKAYPRDDIALAEAQRHRIIRAGIPFGPEVMPGETMTKHSRGLMFVCYQTSIERQFEYIQKNYANDPHFVSAKERPSGGGVVTPGFDPIIGQARGNAPARWMSRFQTTPLETGARRSRYRTNSWS
jgi:Dyp-type peroxidase family